MNDLLCAHNETKLNRVSLCQSAKVICQLLEITREGTSQVKETMISLLTHKYEVFKMEKGETINIIYNHFNDIMVGLNGLGKVIGKVELTRKLLLSLSKEWCPKVIAIEKAKDPTTMSMYELIGSSLTHELTFRMGMEEMKNNNNK